jgi:hypothetical protein
MRGYPGHDLGPSGLNLPKIDTFSSRLLEGVCVKATASSRLSVHSFAEIRRNPDT